jgi:drug/metabolite transporter (DMT)-like permease
MPSIAAAPQSNFKGFLLSLTAAVMWGMLPVALKEVLTGMDATTIVWYRFLIAGVVLWGWLAATKQLPMLASAPVITKWFLLFASASLCANYFFFSYSLNFVNGETSEAVIQLSTLFLILGGVVIYREPFLAVQKLGTLLIVGGLLLFFNERLFELNSLENDQTIGVLIVVAAAITWTVYALLQKQLLKSYTPVQILSVIYAFSIVVLLPLVSPLLVFDLTPVQFSLLAFCCLNTVIAYGCFAEAMSCWDASKVSAVLALAPLFTIASLKITVFVFPDYAFSDRLGLLSIAGAVLLVIGSILTALVPWLYQSRLQHRKDAATAVDSVS